MAKVVTSDGGIQSTEVIVDKRRPAKEAAAPLEMKAGDGVSPPVVDGPETRVDNAVPKVDKEPPKVVNEDDGIDAEDLAELQKAEAAKERKRIGKYVARLRAQEALANQKAEEAQDSERFAEQLFNEREEYRKKLEAAEAKARELEAKVAPPPKAELPPDEKDPKYFNDKGEFQWKQFSTDNAAFEAKKAIAEDRKARDAEAQKERQAIADREFKARLDAAQKKYPDFDKVVLKSPLLLQNEALQYIQQSEYGTDLAYYLAKNPEVAGKIKELHPIRAIAELGKLESSLTKPVEKVTPPVTQVPEAAERQGAPAPITPISLSGTNSPPVDPAKMDFKQLRAYERERAREGRRR
jgi:hypothetical protein